MTADIGILAASYYLPPNKKPLHQVFEDEEKPTETLGANVDFERDIGIEALHVAGEETAADLAINAVKHTMAKSGIDPEEIDLIIDFTSIPEDYVAPTWSAAGQVQQEIGAKRAFVTAINTGGCASYQTTLKVACSLMSANDRYQTALLVAGDKTPEFNHNYFPITVVSDAGSAVILKKNMTCRRILGIEVATVGRLHDMWVIPGIHNRRPEDIGGKYPRWLHVCGDQPLGRRIGRAACGPDAARPGNGVLRQQRHRSRRGRLEAGPRRDRTPRPAPLRTFLPRQIARLAVGHRQ